MRELFQEVFESIKRNRLRTCLTGFAVAWGIFMLIVLLGAGNGLINAFGQSSGAFASNTMTVYGGYTSKPYDGLESGRQILIEDSDVNVTLGEAFANVIDEVSPSIGKSVTMNYGKRYFNDYLEGDYPKRQTMEKLNLMYGRFINDLDIKFNRKVIVLPDYVVDDFLPLGQPLRNIIGKIVKVDGMPFKVVGVTKNDMMSGTYTCYAPYTTVKAIYNRGKKLDDITFTFHGLETEEANEAFEANYRAAININHHASPTDTRAVRLRNRFTQNMQMIKVRRVITIALWILGILTLLGGIVGVSNIMLITVKERTHEFGVRKAIGATPMGITKLIIAESVTITAIFGYIGMVFGLLGCELMDRTLGSKVIDVMGEQIAVFINPTVGVDVAIEATLLLIIAGTIAGLVPATKAARVRPIEALRVD